MDENKMLDLAGSINSLTNVLCNVGLGPYGFGVRNTELSDIGFHICFDPEPVCDSIIFPESIAEY